MLAACTLPGSPDQPQGTSAPTLSPTGTFSASPPPALVTDIPPASTSAPSAEPPGTGEAPLTLTQYTLQVEFDYWGHTLSVSETIDYTNNTPETLQELWLEVESNRRPGSFNLESLTFGEDQPVTGFELQSNQLQIPLPTPLPPGESLTLFIRYNLVMLVIPPATDTTRPIVFGYTERQTNLVDWYPSIPPYRPGEGWLLHKAGYFGEHQVYDMADYHVQITLAQPVTDLLIAASAPAEQTADTYQYQLKNARNFVWTASHMYKMESTAVGDIVVYNYFFPFDVRAGEQALQDTAQALKLYSRLFTPYPYPSLSIVQADFRDSMEFSGLYFLSNSYYNLYDGTPQGYLTAIAAHETAHQWWYSQVGNDQALEPWLDEALSTYTEHIFFENTYPEVLDWWLNYRIDYTEPAGVINGAVYDYDSYLVYRNSVYLYGAQFFIDLRQLIGDDAFFAFLHEYAVSQLGQQSTAQDFFSILQEYTDKDLEPLLSKYFASEE
jgi:hypothetical protein